MRYRIAWGFHDLADWRGAAFMEKQLWDPEAIDANIRLVAVLYFAKFTDDTSLRVMQEALAESQPPNTELNGTEELPVVRGLAAEYLGRRRDQQSFDTVVRLAKTEQDIKLQTSLAKALGNYADPRGVDALVGLGKRIDKGFRARGHADGLLHYTVITSLGKIGTDEALKAIYDGLSGEKTLAQPATGFWRDSTVDKHLDKFLAFYQANPIDDPKPAWRIVYRMLWNRREKLRLDGAEAEAAKRDFLANVNDKEHFAEELDLTRGGEFKVTIDFSFYREDFATVTFSFSDPTPHDAMHRLGNAHVVLYRKSAGRWLPMARVAEEVE